VFHGLVVRVKMRVIVDLESLGIEGCGDLKDISQWVVSSNVHIEISPLLE